MKAFLMFRDRDFALNAELPPNASVLTQDLELGTLFQAMAAGDQFLLEVAKTGLLASLREPTAVRYRQEVLADCLAFPEVVREIYAVAVDAIERERRVWGWTSELPQSALRRAVDVLRIFVTLLKKLRQTASEHGSKFQSEGFQRLFGMLAAELDDEYLRAVEGHLDRLQFHNGILLSAELGERLKGANYVLRKQQDSKQRWRERIQGWIEHLSGADNAGLAFEIDERDEGGFRALSELRDRGIGQVAAALSQSTAHVLSFFRMLRLELGFYVGCLNLRDQLTAKGEPICFPEITPADEPVLSARGLFDVCLSLSMEGSAVGNELAADGKTLVMITGANRGGKSTFLRSAGLAQLMLQCGMFVPAERFRANLCHGLFTHFKREEDASMKSGKLDEELGRMSAIIDRIVPYSMVLCNESFASTNEREGSEIARQIVRSLLETGMKVLFVTHMYDLAYRFYCESMTGALFLRAERLLDGQRTFRLIEGEPLPTSYGRDLYERIFAAGTGTLAPALTPEGGP